MPNHYVTRSRLKHALSIHATSTDDDPLIDAAIEGVSRDIDRFMGFAPYPAVRTRRFQAVYSDRLYLTSSPLLDISRVRGDPDTTYETTHAATDFVLRPFNAPTETPPQPYWEIWTRSNSTVSFGRTDDGVEILGTWGYFNLRDNTTATPSSAHASSDSSMTITGATSLQAGQTILIGSEQVFIRDVVPMASGIVVDRGVNGTTAATHSSGDAIQIYRYDVFERAALYQAGQDFRWTPSGAGGGGAFGAEPGGGRFVGDLHPWVRRMLNPLRTPVAR